MTSNSEKYGMSEGQKLTVFAVIGAVPGAVLDIFYLEMNGRFGAVFGGLVGFIVGFIYLFIRNLKGMKIPKP